MSHSYCFQQLKEVLIHFRLSLSMMKFNPPQRDSGNSTVGSRSVIYVLPVLFCTVEREAGTSDVSSSKDNAQDRTKVGEDLVGANQTLMMKTTSKEKQLQQEQQSSESGPRGRPWAVASLETTCHI